MPQDKESKRDASIHRSAYRVGDAPPDPLETGKKPKKSKTNTYAFEVPPLLTLKPLPNSDVEEAEQKKAEAEAKAKAEVEARKKKPTNSS